MLKFLVRTYLYIRGIRFYKTGDIPRSAVFLKTEIKTVEGRQIVFNFYKESFEDYVHRFGKCYKKVFSGVVVEAKMDESLPPNLYKFNNMRIFFKEIDGGFIGERVASAIVLNAFLDFIIADLADGYRRKIF